MVIKKSRKKREKGEEGEGPYAKSTGKCRQTEVEALYARHQGAGEGRPVLCRHLEGKEGEGRPLVGAAIQFA